MVKSESEKLYSTPGGSWRQSPTDRNLNGSECLLHKPAAPAAPWGTSSARCRCCSLPAGAKRKREVRIQGNRGTASQTQWWKIVQKAKLRKRGRGRHSKTKQKNKQKNVSWDMTSVPMTRAWRRSDPEDCRAVPMRESSGKRCWPPTFQIQPRTRGSGWAPEGGPALWGPHRSPLKGKEADSW